DILLRREHAGKFAVVGVGPDIDTIRGFDELRSYTHARAFLAHRTVDQIPRTEDLAHCAHVSPRAFELESGSARDYLQILDLGERSGDFLRHAVGEKFLRGIA